MPARRAAPRHRHGASRRSAPPRRCDHGSCVGRELKRGSPSLNEKKTPDQKKYFPAHLREFKHAAEKTVFRVSRRNRVRGVVRVPARGGARDAHITQGAAYYDCFHFYFEGVDRYETTSAASSASRRLRRDTSLLVSNSNLWGKKMCTTFRNHQTLVSKQTENER